MVMASLGSVFRPGMLRGRTAIVTGGATGIGRAIARELLDLGCRVMIASRNEERLTDALSGFRQSVGQSRSSDIQATVCNIRKEDQVKDLVSNTLMTYGGLDFLVNNGGGQFRSPASDISYKGWHAVVDTNLNGTFLCSKEVFNQHMKYYGGSIVNIIADMWKGFPGVTHTGAARAAVDNMTKSLSIEWAENGVRINSVAPGKIWSETASENYKKVNPKYFEDQIPGIPMCRLGTPAEISSAVCFLLSPGANFITGATLNVDGGGSLYSQLSWKVPVHNSMPAYTWEGDAQPPSNPDIEAEKKKADVTFEEIVV
ncbi:peroxisomal trans-2-enoyl-CoA reductase-like [Lineus longissimus]|uniref:peroxisomal trans-2-enoyl-CoA reductase-like n=1 Tax=Lineus longissimus TaxID=88925 RepID=UPI002B4D17F9